MENQYYYAMNEVWKNLDPIFQITLRKYVTQNNRSLFDVYAKALGFHSNHIQLLYITLQNVECGVITNNYNDSNNKNDTNHINRKRSYSEMNNIHNQNADNHNNHHNQIRNKRIKTEHNQLQWHSISVYNDNKNTNTEMINNKSVNRNKMKNEIEVKQEQPLIHSVVIRDISPSSSSTESINRSESSIIRSKSTNTNNTMSKSTNSRTGVLKIPSPLPLYNIYRSPVYSKKYQELINKSNETRKQNNNYDVVLSKYQKLKSLSSQSFKSQQMKGTNNSTKDIAVSNKKKINALLANCHSYKNLLNKRGKKLNQNTNDNRSILS